MRPQGRHPAPRGIRQAATHLLPPPPPPRPRLARSRAGGGTPRAPSIPTPQPQQPRHDSPPKHARVVMTIVTHAGSGEAGGDAISHVATRGARARSSRRRGQRTPRAGKTGT
eukprot:scaffold3155_cov358-Prasinococcus_capsulatus_cf.AAC.9